MGGDVRLIFYEGEITKVKKVFRRAEARNPQWFMAPKLEQARGDLREADFWVEYNSNNLRLCFTFGYCYNLHWAESVAQEICRRFKVRKAGWDATGYVSVKEFMKNKPFSREMRMLVNMFSQTTFQRYSKLYQDAARAIFEPEEDPMQRSYHR